MRAWVVPLFLLAAAVSAAPPAPAQDKKKPEKKQTPRVTMVIPLGAAPGKTTKLTVRGLFEIIPRYRDIKKIQNDLRDQLLADKPDVFIGVDYPGFNLGLEMQLKRAGIEIAQKVCVEQTLRGDAQILERK